MNERELPAASLKHQASTKTGDDLVGAALVIGSGPADCCPARPAFRAVLPANGQRTHSTELLLCGHHLRASQVALHEAAAVVYDSAGGLVASID
jgi:hypothetical protein